MPAPQYECSTEAAVALAAATAKTVNGVKGHANSGLLITFFQVEFDGVTASAVPVLVELCYSTWATNSPGTNSTSTTPRQTSGRTIAAGFTAGANWTAEPTALTPIRRFTLTPNGGVVMYDFPLGKEPDADLAQGFAIRCTAPGIVNVTSTVVVSRC